jgi:hypothetical protein
MALTLRTMNKHAQLMGWGDHWGEDDFVILDENGRSHSQRRHLTKVDLACEQFAVPRPAPEQRLGSNA